MESSVAGTHDELLQVLKEKMRLEGQLEALSLEANEVQKDLIFKYSFSTIKRSISQLL